MIAYDTSRYKEFIPNEHFWFTATTLGIDAFLIAELSDPSLPIYVLLWVGLINLYAAYLVVHRSAAHAGKLKLPRRVAEKAQSERTFSDKLTETLLNVRVCLRHLPFILGELSGSLFYLILIVSAYCGVVARNIS